MAQRPQPEDAMAEPLQPTRAERAARVLSLLDLTSLNADDDMPRIVQL
jgi:deoxyribose-phosphate aldolase